MAIIGKLRQSIYESLEATTVSAAPARIIRVGLVVLVILNMLAVALESIDSLRDRYAILFNGLLIFSIVVFTIEYVARIWSCTADPSGRYRRPLVGRLRYAGKPLTLLDLAAILPFFLALFPGVDLRLLRIFRLLWLLKVMRYLPAIATISHVFLSQRRTLLATFVVMLTTLFIGSTLMYVAERDVQPNAFGNIPQAMWWGVTTLTTVGYGDVVPTSPIGRVTGMVIMLLGIGMFALPTAILAAAFIEESNRKDFLVTWNLVAGVPLFSELKAEEIAKVAQVLKPHTAMSNQVIFQRDEPADSMYFILSGQVEAELVTTPKILERGEFFGEIGLLDNQRRSATVIARTYVELLELESDDLQRLLKSDPDIKRKVESVAQSRRAVSPS
jgi:voltage-gated potassium channel